MTVPKKQMFYWRLLRVIKRAHDSLWARLKKIMECVLTCSVSTTLYTLGQDHARFGGFEEDDAEDEERQKSKAEVMKEVIAKSKLYKHERQQVKAADEELRQELDDGLGDIRDLLFSSKPSLAESAAEQAKDNPSTDAKLPLFGSGPKKADAYDSAVRAMAFERRAKPQDRLKTEAEKAEELATKLQKAEQNRLKRMRGDGVSDDEDGSRRSKSRRPAGGDDLEDDFELDGMTSQDVYGLGRGLDAEEAAKDSDEEDDAVKQLDGDKSGDDKTAKLDKYQNEEVVDDDDDTNSGDGEDEDEDEDEDDFADLADVDALAQPGEEDFSDAGEQETLVKSRKDTMKSKPSRTLPFTFACPANLDAFLDMLSASDIQLADIPVVVKRIRALHHPSLAEANKFKLQALIGVLIDYILHISSTLDEVNKTTTMLVINALVPQIFTLTKTYPVPSSEHFVSKLNLMQRNLTRGLSRGALATDSRTWPGIAECVLLKITGMVWPTSDRSHAVTTPLALLISQYLSSCRIRSLQDIARGMFLCSLVVTNERQSARLVPEACNFLHNAISLLAPISSRKQLARLNHAHGIPWPDFGQEHTASIRLTETDKDEEVRPGKVDFVGMVSMSKPREASSSQVMAQMKASLLSSAFALIGELQRMYMGSVAYVELMRPFETLLTKLVKDLPHALEAQRQAVLGPLSRAVSNSAKQRRALRLQAHRAIPLASHVPKFDQGFDPTRKGGKTFDPDAQRAEQAKLRALVKKERKGAVRELRRDNEFLAEARRKAREEEDQRYAKSIDKIMGSFSAERGEEKAYLKEKQKIKRRAGKK